MESERIFTEMELRRYNGDRGTPMYVAVDGVVYDVSDCPHWRNGMHEGLHFPGQDLSTEIKKDSPHKIGALNRNCVRRVGILA